jgi:hypothetical protein
MCARLTRPSPQHRVDPIFDEQGVATIKIAT